MFVCIVCVSVLEKQCEISLRTLRNKRIIPILYLEIAEGLTDPKKRRSFFYTEWRKAKFSEQLRVELY